MLEAYETAELLLPHNRHRLVWNRPAAITWIGRGQSFWYQISTPRGLEFWTVTPEVSSRCPAFDHEELAAAVEEITRAPTEPYELPISDLEIGEATASFRLNDQRWRFDLDQKPIQLNRVPSEPHGVISPDRRWLATVNEGNVWLHDRVGGHPPRQMTFDGGGPIRYGVNPDAHPNLTSSWRLIKTLQAHPRPVMTWSPNSRYLLVLRLDESRVPVTHLIESHPADHGRPRAHRYRYPVPGDELPQGSWLIVDTVALTVVDVQSPPFDVHYVSAITLNRVWWAEDCTRVYVLHQPRDVRSLELHAIDVETGRLHVVYTERSASRVEPGQEILHSANVRILHRAGQFIWYSQADGWGHLYLRRLADGSLIRQLTAGDYVTHHIAYVDQAASVIYVVVVGRAPDNPYARSLLRISTETGEVQPLHDDQLDHDVHFPPHGRWFVDITSDVNTPPKTRVIGTDGAELMTPEAADASPLFATGWRSPEQIQTVAADGETIIHGLLYTPVNFDPSRKYPLIDHVYPGPQMRRTSAAFQQGDYGCEGESLCALGFAVLALDGRGTPGRDKAFHDYSYGNLSACGALEDHVAAIEQLAAQRTWLDRERVGVVGRSGGGFAAATAIMRYPHIFKVAVAEAGNHDNRYYHAWWAETFHGHTTMYDPLGITNLYLAPNLEGKLLLIHGEMDDNVMSSQTLRLVAELISHDKDFDLLIVPGADHTFIGFEHYLHRKRWDYFVRHLRGENPPRYRLRPIHPNADLLLLASS